MAFTLVELIAVTAVVCILAGAAVPVFITQREHGWRSAVESDVESAALAVSSAASAMPDESAYSISLDGAGKSVSIPDGSVEPASNNPYAVPVAHDAAHARLYDDTNGDIGAVRLADSVGSTMSITSGDIIELVARPDGSYTVEGSTTHVPGWICRYDSTAPGSVTWSEGFLGGGGDDNGVPSPEPYQNMPSVVDSEGTDDGLFWEETSCQSDGNHFQSYGSLITYQWCGRLVNTTNRPRTWTLSVDTSKVPFVGLTAAAVNWNMTATQSGDVITATGSYDTSDPSDSVYGRRTLAPCPAANPSPTTCGGASSTLVSFWDSADQSTAQPAFRAYAKTMETIANLKPNLNSDGSNNGWSGDVTNHSKYYLLPVNVEYQGRTYYQWDPIKPGETKHYLFWPDQIS